MSDMTDSGPDGAAAVADLRARLAEAQDQKLRALADADDDGAVFDPARHEAVATAHDPRVPPGTVVQVVRAGYGEPDHQLRPAQVVVAKAD
jgi:molecular chaperone GrpE